MPSAAEKAPRKSRCTTKALATRLLDVLAKDPLDATQIKLRFGSSAFSVVRRLINEGALLCHDDGTYRPTAARPLESLSDEELFAYVATLLLSVRPMNRVKLVMLGRRFNIDMDLSEAS